MAREHHSRVTSLLRQWSGGDPGARNELVPLVYQELRRLAHYHLRRERSGHTLQTTALVHEVYLRLCGHDDPQWEGRAHFFAVAARMMRRILVDYSRRRGAEKRGADAVHLGLDEALTIPLKQPFYLVALDGAMEQLAEFDARKCQVVEMRFFVGLGGQRDRSGAQNVGGDRTAGLGHRQGLAVPAPRGVREPMNSDLGNPGWAEVERALAAALELPEEKRAAFLAKLTAPARAEVESLLAAHLRAGSFLGGETAVPSSGASRRSPSAIKINTQIGSYRIEAKIGTGGMGVVYRALDIKLNRPVAIKFLFDDLADAAARRRFQREAQTASSLNHPHILTVYDTGEFEGCQYLVTEFIDGGTLATWARSEKRTWREIVSLLTGVADGLAAAHAAGILHRDIKPDNILVGRNGYAKLADFGLAKLEEHTTPEAVTRTIASETTKRGVIVGTIAYMSPEQASGRPVDTRSDIFSFGVVIYELLAGGRPFRGRTDLEVMQQIIHGAAAPLGDDVTLGLRVVVEKAIEKDPADRYQGMQDLVVDLRRMTRQGGETARARTAATPAAGSPALSVRSVVFAGLVLLVVVLAVGMFFLWSRRPAAEAPRQVVQFDIPPPPETIFTPTVSRQPFAMSPDGKRLAFSATGPNGTNLWIRDLASPEIHVVPGTDGVWSMYWAPDSHSILFSVKRTLKQVNLDTGSSRKVADLPAMAMLAMWRSNSDILLYPGPGELYEVRLQDGSVEKGPVFQGMRWPQMFPGGNRVIYGVYDKASQQSHAVTADYATRTPVSLMETDSRVEYAAPLHSGDPGYLLFIREGSLLAQAFDADRLKLSGEPVPIAQNVLYYGPNLAANFSTSENGVLAYQAGFPNAELKWYDRTGTEVGEAGPPMQYWGNVRVSRDGRRAAAAVWSAENGSTSIWSFDADRRENRRITFPPEVYRRPVWSPDGKHLAVGRSPRVGGPELAVLDFAGNGAPQEFTGDSRAHVILPTDWSQDGRFIACDDGVGEEQHTAWIADVTTHKLMPLLDSNFAQWGTAFAPDGKRIAFVSMESGRPEVYIQAFEPTPAPHLAGDRRQVSRNSAWLVRWRADGRELFFVGLDNMLHAVAIQGPLEFGEPKSLFRIAGVPQYGTTRDFQFDVSPDGQRFILPTTGSAPPPPFTVIENWQDKFRR